ncbi:vitamin K epoxide reductase family protein [Mucilaginibacter sp. UYCu711]|uniref:vitamin K epoxide reductase family protein n=1 Tax=Mucilaginibacter sp. UYCu711 TaxID=3156339 RepID=UPI003D24F4CA
MRQLITRLLEPKDNAPEAAFLLAQLMGAKISRSSLEKDIKTHPDYPAFLSISDVLNNHGIENLTAKFDYEKLAELPTPFITQYNGKKHGHQFTVVKDITGDIITFYNPEDQAWRKTGLKSFSKQNQLTVLLAEIEEPIKEKDYEKNIQEEKRIRLSQSLVAACLPLLLLAVTLLAFFDRGIGALTPALYAILTLAGMAITTLLLWYEVDQNNAALQDICKAGKKVNCGAILDSKAAKIFGISWSAIGFVYFAGGLITLLLTGLSNPGSLMLLSWLTFTAIPYVFYSVYYQWRVAKQWCVLCLSVQTVLVLQCAITFIGGWYNVSLLQNGNIFNMLVQIVAAFAIPFIVITLLLPALRRAKENGQLTLELQRLKHSPEIFRAVLEKQKALTVNPEGLGIIMGNPDAKVKIIKVCNPYCGPCARVHTPMDDLLHNNPELQVQIIFTATADENDYRSKPVKHLLAIDQKQQDGLTEQALGDWYLAEKKDYDVFAKKYPMNGELKKQDEKVEAMRDWCAKTDIQFTPTFFVDGYQLPSNYSVNDLKYFLSV